MKKLVLLSVLALSGCNIDAELSQSSPRQISVNGMGSELSVPDQFNFSVVIEERGSSASELNQLIASKTEVLIEALLALGIEERDIRSTQVQFYPWVEYVEQTQQHKGFILNRQIQLSLNDVALYDKAIDTVLQQKINRIEGFSYADSQASQRYQRALELALQDAKLKASLMAAELDMQLGRTLNINELSQGQVQSKEAFMTARTRMASDSLPGEMSTQAQVAVSFELVDASQTP